MRHLLKYISALLLAVVALFSVGAIAQSSNPVVAPGATITVTANTVYGSRGQLLSSGRICFLASAGSVPTCGQVANGMLAAPISIKALATNQTYTIQVFDYQLNQNIFSIQGITSINTQSWVWDQFIVPAGFTATGVGMPGIYYCASTAIYTQTDATAAAQPWKCVSGLWYRGTQVAPSRINFTGIQPGGGNLGGGTTTTTSVNPLQVQINGNNAGSQTKLNLKSGTNTSLADDGQGGITISTTGQTAYSGAGDSVLATPQAGGVATMRPLIDVLTELGVPTTAPSLPTISIGTVTTGNTPAVTNVGTSTNQIWNFTFSAGAPTATPSLSISPSPITFPMTVAGVQATPLQVTVTNNALSYYSVSGIAISGTNAGDFSQTNNCGTQIASGGTCTITIGFVPTNPNTGLSWSESAVVTINGPSSFTANVVGSGQVLNGGLQVVAQSLNVQSGQVVSITANRPVTFSTPITGTIAATDSTHFTYTAPAHIPQGAVYYGCNAGPIDGILNAPIDTLPVHPDNAKWLSQVAGYALGFQPSWTPNVFLSTPTMQPLKLYYFPGDSWSVPVNTYPYHREGGQLNSRVDGRDHHIQNLVAPTCTFYETYNQVLAGSNATYTCQDGSAGCQASSAMSYSPFTSTIPAYGTDAAGLPLYVAPTIQQIKTNTIHQPVRLTLAGGFISYTHVWPAVGAGPANPATSMPYGARLRLKSTFSTNGYSQYAQNVLNAFKKYGIILADAGTSGALQWNSDIYLDPAVAKAVQEAQAGLTLANFEGVDESALQISPNSYQIKPNNPYVTPPASAYVIATDTNTQSDGNKYSISLPIELQGVGVTLPNPQLTMYPGSYTYQLQGYVTGSSNQGVTWTIATGQACSPNCGSVSTSGVYTPPTASAITAPTSVTVTATPTADSAAATPQFITLMPWGADGNIRIVGDTAASISDDASPANAWFGEYGMLTGNWNNYALYDNGWTNFPSPYTNNCEDANGNPIAGVAWDNGCDTNGHPYPEAKIYMRDTYSYGDDLNFRLILPSGHYRVRWLQGQNATSYKVNGIFSSANRVPKWYGTADQITAHAYQWGLMSPVPYTSAYAWDYNMPANVTSNVLDLWHGGTIPEGDTSGHTPAAHLNAIEIIPDATAAHISIDSGIQQWKPQATLLDTTGTVIVPFSTTYQLYATGWYMSNSVTWTVSGGGAISSSGLYTAPTTQPNFDTSVTVTATSTVDNTKTATITLVIPGVNGSGSGGSGGGAGGPVTFACTNNSTTDPTGVQTAINGGGTVTLTGTCNLGAAAVIAVNNPVVVQGGATLLSTNTNAAIAANSDNVTFNNLTFDGAGVHSAGASYDHRTALNFDHDTFRNFINASGNCCAIEVDSVWINSHVTNSAFTNSWEGGFTTTANATSVPGGHLFIVNNGGLDNVKIEYNTFNQSSYDAMHIISNGLEDPVHGYCGGPVSISYNTILNIHRMGIEYQGQTSLGSNAKMYCGTGADVTPNTSVKIAGNLYHSPAYPGESFGDTFGISAAFNSMSLQLINNTVIADYGTTPLSTMRLGYGVELMPGYGCGTCGAGVQGTYAGNVIGSDHRSSDPSGWYSVWKEYDNPTHLNQIVNNLQCGDAANAASIGSDSNYNWTYNYLASGACPNGTGAAMYASTLVANPPVWTSANNQSILTGSTGTWTVNVPAVSLSMRYVSFYLDGSSTPAVVQETQVVSTSFATDRIWHYAASINTTSLSVGTHTISAVATDVSGATASTSTSQTFTVSGASVPIASISPTSLSWPSAGTQTVSLSNTGNASLSISGTSFTGASASDFTVSSTTCGSSLTVGGSCSYVIAYTPTGTAGATEAATFNIANNSGTSPVTASLTGLVPVYSATNVAAGGTTVAQNSLYQPANLTTSVWINGSTQTNYPVFMASGGSDTTAPYESWVLQAATINGNNVADMWLLTGTGANTHIYGTTKLVANTTYMITATYDGTTVKLYVNGNLEASGNTTPSGSIYYFGSNGLSVARKYSNTGSNFTGSMPGATEWNTALTPAQIAYIYAQGAPH